jgi:hypothetical protein
MTVCHLSIMTHKKSPFGGKGLFKKTYIEDYENLLHDHYKQKVCVHHEIIMKYL